MGPPKEHGPLMWLKRDKFVEASLLGLADNRPFTPQTIEEEVVLPGEEPEPQEALEVNMSSLDHPRTLEPEPLEALEVTTSPHEHPRTPELEEPTKQSDAPSPPAPPPMASSSQGNHSQKTKRARCGTKAQYLLTRTTPRNGSRHTSMSEMSCQTGGKNLGHSTTRVQGP